MRIEVFHRHLNSIVSSATICVAAIASLYVEFDSAAADKRVQHLTPAYTGSVIGYSRTSNAVIFHPQSGKIYASIPSGNDPQGNSIARVDPMTGTIEQSVWIGSEPNKLALAADGNTLYVGLNGSRAIRKFYIATSTPGDQFQVGRTNYDGPLLVVDFALSPTDPNVVAVARTAEAHSGANSVAIFDNGVRRQNHGGTSEAVTFTDTDATVYGSSFSNSLQRLSVNASGVSSVSTILSPASGSRIQYADGKLFTTSGHVIDAASGTLLGTFPLGDAYPVRRFVVDVPARRVIFVAHNYLGLRIESFDMDTYVMAGFVQLQDAPTYPKSVARWGTNGLAVSMADGPTYFIQSDLIGPGTILPAVPLPETVSTPFWGAFIRRVTMPNNDMVFNPLDQKLYVSVPGNAGPPMGNTITRLDPVTGATVSSAFIGSEPGKLGLSTDGTTLWSSLNGAYAIRRFDTLSQTPGLQFIPDTNLRLARQIVVLPGAPQSIVVSANDGGIAVYDNGVKRPDAPGISVGPAIHNGTPNVIYGYNDASSAANLYTLAVTPTGLNILTNVQNVIYRANVRIVFDNGKIYASDGTVIDPETSTIVAKFAVSGINGINVDYARKKVFFVGTNSIEVFDLDTYNKLGSIRIPEEQTSSFPESVYRWGFNGLAVRVSSYPGQGGGHINLIQSPLVATAKPFDFDGDGKTDIGIFRPSLAEWWVQKSGSNNVFATQFGLTEDNIVPADYTGDGKTDIGVWRPASGEWFVLRSDDFSYFSIPFGANGDVPAVGDYDADGKADTAVFRPSSATWFIRRSSDGQTMIQQFGSEGDTPVVADYDRDGRADIAIFRPALGQWWFNRSTGGVIATTFGGAGDKPVVGDYTGDGKADAAFWRPTTGEWFVLRSEDFSFFSFPFGADGDVPAPGDYDGDGRHDATVFRGSNATWYSRRTTSGTLIQQFGATGDRPIPNAFVP